MINLILMVVLESGSGDLESSGIRIFTLTNYLDASGVYIRL